ncbi:MAG TPA: SMP-30/gluconolactonase/LRE family protein [Kofleriaceae bacterium]|nr:SMP-30/gluconolactonase/LRE family protein [Kofleriaceae bacterium]
MRARGFVLVVASFALVFCGCDDEPGIGPFVDGGVSDGGGVPDGGGIPDDAGPLPAGVATLAGSGMAGFADGFRDGAMLANPVNVAVLPGGDVVVADFDNNAIRRVTPEGLVTTMVSEDAGLVRPFGLAVGEDGNVFVETDGNGEGGDGGAIWLLSPDAGTITVVADNVGRPRGLAVLDDGRVALSDDQAHTISLLDPDTGDIQVLAGAPGQAGFLDGTGGEARFSAPADVVVDPDGALLVADNHNHRIRRVTLAGQVTTVAGTGMAASDDGAALDATFNGPQGLAVSEDGTVFVSEMGGHVIRRLAGGQVTTVAGTGTAGFENGDPDQAEFFGLEGIDLDAGSGILYIADGNQGNPGPYNRVRRLTLAE